MQSTGTDSDLLEIDQIVTNNLEDECKRMTRDHFKAAIKNMKLQSNDVVKAAYLVMFHNYTVGEATEKCNVSNSSQVSRALTNIKESWRKIVDANGYMDENMMLTPREVEFVREIMEKPKLDKLMNEGSEGWKKYQLDEFEAEIREKEED